MLGGRTFEVYDSIVVQLSESEFQGGLAALREHAVTAPTGAVVELVDFLAFRAASVQRSLPYADRFFDERLGSADDSLSRSPTEQRQAAGTTEDQKTLAKTLWPDALWSKNA
jgi:hypothetical protein